MTDEMREEAWFKADMTLKYLGGQRALVLMLGATNFSVDEHGTLKFRFKMNPRINYVEFKLVNDLYTVSFYRIRKLEMKLVQQIEGLFFDQLKDVFERETGLSIRIPRIIGINA